MQIELNTSELSFILKAIDREVATADVLDLQRRLNTELEMALELEDMDLDDCAGGACKL